VSPLTMRAMRRLDRALVATRPPRLRSEPMHHLWILLVLVAAAINLAPVLGAVAPERMAALYGVDLRDPNLQILLRHRAVLFGIVGGLLVAAAFVRRLRTTGYVVGFASMVSFLLIAWAVGDYSAEIGRVARVDAVGIAALAGAGLLDVFWLGRRDDQRIAA